MSRHMLFSERHSERHLQIESMELKDRILTSEAGAVPTEHKSPEARKLRSHTIELHKGYKYMEDKNCCVRFCMNR